VEENKKMKTNVSRRDRRVRRGERNTNELPNTFCYYILTHFGVLCALCGLERSGREKSRCLFTSPTGYPPDKKTFSRGYKGDFNNFLNDEKIEIAHSSWLMAIFLGFGARANKNGP
jgi:hypothetical protein